MRTQIIADWKKPTLSLAGSYMKRVPLKEAEREFSGGTVSRLGLVLKIKDDGQKKRRILDPDRPPPIRRERQECPAREAGLAPIDGRGETHQGNQEKEHSGVRSSRRRRDGTGVGGRVGGVHGVASGEGRAETHHGTIDQGRGDVGFPSLAVRLQSGPFAVQQIHGLDREAAAGSR